MTAFRLRDRVYVTHEDRGGLWYGTVINAHPAGDRTIYTVRDGNGDDHSGIEAGRMTLDRRERAS